MGKKNIILKESQISKLFDIIIKEASNYENQDLIDSILDKINEFGYESLTEKEKYILKNPDEKIEDEYQEVEQDEDVLENPIISMLIDAGFLNSENITSLDKNTFEVDLVSDDDGNIFRYFEDGNIITLITHIDGDELMVEADEHSNKKEVHEVMEYIKEMWGGFLGFPVYVDSIDF